MAHAPASVRRDGRGRVHRLRGRRGLRQGTQAALLADALDAVLTRETGGTAIGQRLRADPPRHRRSIDLDDRAEALIVAADRAQHIAEVVAPGAGRRPHVVSDRSVYSTLAYQGYGRGLDLDELRRINDWAIDGLLADLVVLLDAPPDVAGRPARRPRSSTASSRPATTFHAARRSTASGRWPPPTRERWIVVDAAERAPDAVAAAVRAAVRRAARRARRDVTQPVWDGVVGQPTPRSTRCVGRRRARCTPTCSSARRARRRTRRPGPSPPLLLTGARRRRQRATPAWRWPASTPTSARSSASGRRSPPSRPTRSSARPSLAPVEGAPQGARSSTSSTCSTPTAPARLLKTIEEPPPSTHVRRARRLRARRPGHDRLALRAHRVRADRRDRASPTRLVAEGTPPDARRRRSPAPPAATSTGPGCSPPTPASPSAAGAFAGVPAPARRHRRAPWSPPSTSCSAASRPPPRRWPTARPTRWPSSTRASSSSASAAAAGQAIEERHKRELRRHRTDELRSGLAVIAGAYRDALVDGTATARPTRVDRRGPPHPRHASRRSSTTPTRRCCCSRCCGRSRRCS